MNTNVNTHLDTSAAPRHAHRLIKTASGPIATPKIHPSITKQSQFPAPKIIKFITKPEKSPAPSANPHRISKHLLKNPEIPGFDIQDVGFGGPFSRVRWPQNRPLQTHRTRANSVHPRRHLFPSPNAPQPCASDRHSASSDKLKLQVAACSPQAPFFWRIQNRVVNLCG